MAFTSSGSTANQSGTDNNSVNLIPINGFNALAGNRQIEGSSRQINVAGNYTVRESMRLQRFVVTATGNLTLGQVDGSGVVMPCIIYLTSTTGFAYPSQAISCDDGATLSLNNSVVVVETGNNNAGFGSFNKLNWTFNALNSEIIHEQRAWDYLAGNGVIKNLTVRNTRCIFFHGSPTELSNLTVIDTEWGIGIDNSTGATVRVTKSKTPRSMIQRGNNYFDMVDTQITEWIGSRFEPSATSGWRFIKTMQTASVGALANANTTAHTLASDNSTLDSTALGADGSLLKEVQWGRALGNVAGLNTNPNTLANKMTASMINTNTGTYKHVAGDYKLPLAVAFVSYNGELQVQEGITFDVSADAYRDNFIMAPNLGVDPLVTELSQAVANAYTTQVGSIRLYDKGKAVFTSNYTNERAVYISRVGDTLVLGSKSFTATAASVFSQSLTAIVATAAVWLDNIMTTGAVELEAIAEGKTIDGAVSVKLTTLPSKITIKNSAQGILLETAGTYDVSQFTFEGNTLDITIVGNNAITLQTGGKTVNVGGNTANLTIDSNVAVTFSGMPTGLGATQTPIHIEELDGSEQPLNPRVHHNIFSDSVTGSVSVTLKPNTHYRYKADAGQGYKRSNGDTYKTFNTSATTAITLSLTQTADSSGVSVYGQADATRKSKIQFIGVVGAHMVCHFVVDQATPITFTFFDLFDYLDDILTSHSAMIAGLRQPSFNTEGKEIIFPSDTTLRLDVKSDNLARAYINGIVRKTDDSTPRSMMMSPFASPFGLDMVHTIITAKDTELLPEIRNRVNTIADNTPTLDQSQTN